MRCNEKHPFFLFLPPKMRGRMSERSFPMRAFKSSSSSASALLHDGSGFLAVFNNLARQRLAYLLVLWHSVQGKTNTPTIVLSIIMATPVTDRQTGISLLASNGENKTNLCSIHVFGRRFCQALKISDHLSVMPPHPPL
jgi:hypothetical protein